MSEYTDYVYMICCQLWNLWRRPTTTTIRDDKIRNKQEKLTLIYCCGVRASSNSRELTPRRRRKDLFSWRNAKCWKHTVVSSMHTSVVSRGSHRGRKLCMCVVCVRVCLVVCCHFINSEHQSTPFGKYWARQPRWGHTGTTERPK